MLLDEPTTIPDAPPVPTDEAGPRTKRHPTGLYIVLGSLVLAAISLALPSAPTYDPWSWIVWGREIAHLDLMTTEGPSWKPLPVLFTVPFSFFGEAAPDLWLVIARAGFFAAIPLAFELARRLGGGVAGGVAAAAALALAPWMVRNAWLGNSEPLLIALMLAALLRGFEHRHRDAFALAFAAGLLRPEIWPFLGLYGLWLLWKRELSPALVVGGGIATVALWTLPEVWGSGEPLRAISRAQEPNANAATFSDNPALTVVENAFAMIPWPVEVGAAAGAILLGLHRDRRLLGILLVAAAWLGLVAVMTSGGGFSGNLRYLMPPVALLIVLAGAGAGWALAKVPRVPLAVAVAVLALPFGLAHAGRLQDSIDESLYQSRITDDIRGLVADAGGRERVLRCGTPYTGAFFVPQIAWALDVHTSEVDFEPRSPGVIFRVRSHENGRVVPTLSTVVTPERTWASAGDHWRVVAACGGRM